LKREIERLKVERRDLAAELEKVQNLLKMQVGIDKENAHIYQQEIDQIKSQIAADNRKITELSQVVT
jgi:thymidylate synthase